MDSVRVDIKLREARMCHNAELSSELSSSLDLAIDVTPQIYAPNDVINSCADFLESRNIDAESVQAFRLLISEALANAIEHGVLCLPSTLKEDPFHPYHEVLRNRLNEIKPGQVFLRIRLLHENGRCDTIKAIRVEVTDSGPGFDWRSHLNNAKMPAPDKPYGRGLALIKMIADQISFNESGNSIQFVIPCSSSQTV